MPLRRNAPDLKFFYTLDFLVSHDSLQYLGSDALPTHALFHELHPRDTQQRVEKPFACLRPQPEPWSLFARLHARHHLEAAASVEYQIFCFRVNRKTHKVSHTVFTTSLGSGLALVGGPVVPEPAPLVHV